MSDVHRASRWRAIFTFSHFPGETKVLRRTAGLIRLCLRDQHCRAGENYFAQAIRANIFEGKKEEKKSNNWVRLVEVAHGPSSIWSVHSFFISIRELWASSDKPHLPCCLLIFNPGWLNREFNDKDGNNLTSCCRKCGAFFSYKSHWVEAGLVSIGQLDPAGRCLYYTCKCL